ncbi:hypothetical protein G9H64_09965 [Aquirufa nivalisilvae]|uniref:hypothetical protein n=1 Tax=Aquirufa nivalisilvae TaxID=2516557 RepID=UPI0022A8E5C1|nr:hypothetical protein [Aquirufa nivalisilvae]MCZ2479054.1 hypothetical protein [Aquirufa nivalisilvae]MCZ2483281.1 hypothetical protein [Aquirufa nivalisilvae]
MNIALGSIVGIVFLLPGILFRKGYFSGEFSKQFLSRDFFQLFINTLIPSIFIYLIAWPICYLLGWTYDFRIILGLIASSENLNLCSIEAIINYQLPIIVFLIIINLSSFCVGISLNIVVRRNWLDVKYTVFRYENIWHYILTAKFFHTNRSQFELSREEIDDIEISYCVALVCIGGENILYNGILIDYQLSHDGGLDMIYLKDAKRRLINKPSGKYENIDGSIFVLKYENVINLNLTFYRAELELDENEELTINLIKIGY